jgi:hypothetical protein
MSAEYDFGYTRVRNEPPTILDGTWRVSWRERTGELYAKKLLSANEIVLGVFSDLDSARPLANQFKDDPKGLVVDRR